MPHNPARTSFRVDDVTGPDRDVTQLLTAQHDQIDALLTQVDQPGVDLEDLFVRLRRMLAVHETMEEEIVYPALRASSHAGDAVASARLDEEADVQRRVDDLAPADFAQPDAARRLEELRAVVRHHAEMEEREVFPALRETHDADELAAMARLLIGADTPARTLASRTSRQRPSDDAMVVGSFRALAQQVRDAIRSIEP
jgi:hemerythrin superfamily protein